MFTKTKLRKIRIFSIAVILIGKKSNLKDFPNVSIRIGDDVINPSTSARNIGAVMDQNLSMSDHISAVARGAWFHLRQIAKIRPYLDQDSAKSLIHSFVSSRLDSFNSLLYGIPNYEINKLQRIQNAAAKVIAGLRKHDHVTPTLINLHWLPVLYRIDYKILVLVYKALNDLAPEYISSLLKRKTTPRTLRNDNIVYLIVPSKNNVTYGERAFCFAGPHLWNLLPAECKTASSLNIFKRRLKTHLFKLAYDV